MAQVSAIYIAASTNRFHGAAHSSSDSLVAFGSFKYIALWDAADTNDTGVYQTLAGHEGIVTCVRYVDKDKNTFVSGDDRGVIRYWKFSESKWINAFHFQAHDKPVSALTAFTDCIVTGGSDSSVKIWKINHRNNGEPDSVEQLQKLDLGIAFPLDVQVTSLPGTSFCILAIASTEKNIGIWVKAQNEFTRATTLSGHEDWVNCLSFRDGSHDSLMLASGSQDGMIRLWSISSLVVGTQTQSKGGANDLMDDFEASVDDRVEEDGLLVSLKNHMIHVKSEEEGTILFHISLDALLIGHEGGITSLSWRTGSQREYSDPALLSTSTDSSVILWAQMPVSTSDKSNTLWISKHRFGDVGGQRLGGFVGGLWICDGRDVIVWGWSGSWRRWQCQSDTEALWSEAGAISGHNGPVRSVNWAPSGNYVISASADQSTRIHGKIQHGDVAAWHELGRPQIHGYDLVSAVFIDDEQFVSIADEKVVRVFGAPGTFLNYMKAVGNMDRRVNEVSRPLVASVPPLGLSNKASTAESDSALAITIAAADRKLFEGELSSMTLWPETEKIFGHGHELISLTVSLSGKYTATACRATSAEDAVIRVYETGSWKLFGSPLHGHTLTVTKLAFSPDDQYLLSVSRDRNWRLYIATNDGFKNQAVSKSHGRVIWDCDWAGDNSMFATASRDKTVKIWKRSAVEDDNWATVSIIQATEAATSVAWCPATVPTILAVGLESGEISLYDTLQSTVPVWQEIIRLDNSLAHCAPVNCLAWRTNGLEVDKKELCSGSEDGTVKVFGVKFLPN